MQIVHFLPFVPICSKKYCPNKITIQTTYGFSLAQKIGKYISTSICATFYNCRGMVTLLAYAAICFCFDIIPTDNYNFHKLKINFWCKIKKGSLMKLKSVNITPYWKTFVVYLAFLLILRSQQNYISDRKFLIFSQRPRK